jgi:hypothetical protein
MERNYGPIRSGVYRAAPKRFVRAARRAARTIE